MHSRSANLNIVEMEPSADGQPGVEPALLRCHPHVRVEFGDSPEFTEVDDLTQLLGRAEDVIHNI